MLLITAVFRVPRSSHKLRNCTRDRCNLETRLICLVDRHRSEVGVRHEINIIYCLRLAQMAPQGGGGAVAGRESEHVSTSIMTTALRGFCFVRIKLNCDASPERYN